MNLNEYITKLSIDEPIIFDKDNYEDQYGKANLVKKILVSYLSNDDIIKEIIAIFGEWGSGKSSLIKTIDNMVSNDTISEDINVIHFDSWKYETNKDLTYAVTSRLEKNLILDDRYKNKIKEFFARRWVEKFNVGVPGILNVEFKDTREIDKIDEVIDVVKKIDNKIKKTIFFIDDLDRCDNKKVVDLIINLKLFFSICKNIVFVIAVDKSFILESINYYYSKMIDSERYLEKMIGISFSIPYSFNYSKEDTLFMGKEKFEIFFDNLKIKTARKKIKIIRKFNMLNFLINMIGDEYYKKIKDQFQYWILYFLIQIEFNNKILNQIENKLWSTYSIKTFYEKIKGSSTLDSLTSNLTGNSHNFDIKNETLTLNKENIDGYLRNLNIDFFTRKFMSFYVFVDNSEYQWILKSKQEKKFINPKVINIYNMILEYI